MRYELLNTYTKPEVSEYVSLLPLLCITVYPDRVSSSNGFIPDDRFMTVCQKAGRRPAVTVCVCVGVYMKRTETCFF